MCQYLTQFHARRILTALIIACLMQAVPATPAHAQPASLDPLSAAAHTGDRAAVDVLLRQGAHINIQDAYGQTPLMYAVNRGDLPLVKTLLEAGADLHIINAYNMTPLKLSYFNKTPHISQQLLAHGATSSTFSIDEWQALNTQLGTAPAPPKQALSEAPPRTEPGRVVHTPPATTAKGLGTLPTLAIAGGVVAGVVGIVIAGGDDNGGTPPISETPIETPVEAPGSTPGAPSSFETEEYNQQPGLSAINASAAYSRGATGQGVTVAVIDTGVDLTHPDLAASVLSTGSDVLAPGDGSPVGDGESKSHGTNVAGIIAATKDETGMHGVAYGANILSIRAAESDGILNLNTVPSAFDYARVQGVNVINASYGTASPIGDAGVSANSLIIDIGSQLSSFQMNAAQNIVHVFAAGNEGRDQVNLEAGLPFYFPDLQPLWLAAVSVDANNGISSFSNRCGLAANWCLAAPGEGIYTTSAVEDTNQTGNYATVLGTSFAAPHVSGAVAVLMNAFPSLTPQQIVELLLSTATDLGDPGVDPIYGRGLINLDAASAPQGTVSVALAGHVNGRSAPLNQTSLQLGPAFGDALQQVSGMFMVLDRYQRPYTTALQDLHRQSDESIDRSRTFLEFGSTRFKYRAQAGDALSLSYNPADKQRFYDVQSPESVQEQGQYAVQASFGSQEVHGYHNVRMADAFGLSPHQDYAPHHRIGSHTLANPYLALVDSGTGLVHHTPLTNDIAMQFGSFHGSVVDESGDQDAYGVVAELTYRPVSRLTFGLQLGSLSEDITFLGSRASGALALEDGSETLFAGLSSAWRVSDQLTLHGSYMLGRSRISAGQHSLFSNVSNITSDSFSIGATYKDAQDSGKLAGIAFTQPLRVRTAEALLTLPVARTLDGRIIREQRSVDLAPKGREMDIESFYRLPLEDDTAVTFGGMVRFEPDHQQDAEPDGLFMIKYNRSF